MIRMVKRENNFEYSFFYVVWFVQENANENCPLRYRDN
jgi:hypothetical protein